MNNRLEYSMGWNRERERRGFKGEGQQGRAPPELAGSRPAAEVERRAGGRRRWDLAEGGVGLGLSGGRRGAGWVEGGVWGWGIFRVNFGRRWRSSGWLGSSSEG
jgi:hypothetical protein